MATRVMNLAGALPEALTRAFADGKGRIRVGNEAITYYKDPHELAG